MMANSSAEVSLSRTALRMFIALNGAGRARMLTQARRIGHARSRAIARYFFSGFFGPSTGGSDLM